MKINARETNSFKKIRVINVKGIYLLHAGQNILQFGDYFE